MLSQLVLEVKHLNKYFPIYKGVIRSKVSEVKAVDDINFAVSAGETLGLVGESGSGKTTVGRLIVGSVLPTSGQILFKGENMAKMKKHDARSLTKKVQMVFQDPASSLNPRKKVRDLILDPLEIHGINTKIERLDRVIELLELVELSGRYLERYPHMLSGGEKQRVSFARAVALNPELLVMDEPTSALDVSVQAKVVDLVLRLQKLLNLTYLFISHDIVLVKNVSHKIGIMYLGKMMEIASTEELFANPMHPYTLSLLSSVPLVEAEEAMLPRNVENRDFEGQLAHGYQVGCPFYSRCPIGTDVCKEVFPEAKKISEKHLVFCQHV